MKRALLALIFLLVLSQALLAVGDVSFGYLHIKWGSSVDLVNEQLQKSNMIETAGTARQVVMVETTYPDPEIVWYNKNKGKWMHFNFVAPEKMDALIAADENIYYLTEGDATNFSVLEYGRDEMVPKGRGWVYRFYFHKGYLFATSLRYENNEEENVSNEYFGHVMDPYIYKANMDVFRKDYGGAEKKYSKKIDHFSVSHYFAYFSNKRTMPLTRANDLVLDAYMILYYHEFYGYKANFTVSYTDNRVFNEVVPNLQKKIYHMSSIELNTIEY